MFVHREVQMRSNKCNREVRWPQVPTATAVFLVFVFFLVFLGFHFFALFIY